jgi:hypothetical protein
LRYFWGCGFHIVAEFSQINTMWSVVAE